MHVKLAEANGHIFPPLDYVTKYVSGWQLNTPFVKENQKLKSSITAIVLLKYETKKK